MPPEVVALLRYPSPITGIDTVVRGLERMHGKGLVIRTDLGGGEWMAIAKPMNAI